MSKIYSFKQIENMHGHRFISLGQQEHACLGSALHLIQIQQSPFIKPSVNQPKIVWSRGGLKKQGLL